jgi:DNA-binding transcriptional LysR family regulator
LAGFIPWFEEHCACAPVLWELPESALEICKYEQMSFDWTRARSFLATAEEGSFSAAARSLGLTQPTIGRQVAALEEELGVVLFARVGKRVELTEAGGDLLEHVRTMEEAANRVSLLAEGRSVKLEGTVRIAASGTIGAFLLPPVIEALRRAHPGIELELVFSNETSDIVRREADIAIRNFRPDEPDLVARKVSEHKVHLYATPAYLDSIGRPATPEALSAQGQIFGFSNIELMIKVLNAQGYALSPASFGVRTEDNLVQWAMCLRGLGVCMMMEEVGDAEPRVEKVLPDHPAPVSFPTWITSHRDLKTSRRIRVVFDLLVERFSDGLEVA